MPWVFQIKEECGKINGGNGSTSIFYIFFKYFFLINNPISIIIIVVILDTIFIFLDVFSFDWNYLFRF